MMSTLLSSSSSSSSYPGGGGGAGAGAGAAVDEHMELLFSRQHELLLRKRENNNGGGSHRLPSRRSWSAPRQPSSSDILLAPASPLSGAVGGGSCARERMNKLDNKECFKCNRRFRTPSLLRNHIRIHNGEKPYHCRVCNRSFSEKGNMAKHFQAVHKNARPYVCATCDRNFSQKHQLISHHEAFHAKRRFACLICSRNCTSNRQLRLHAMRHGPDATRLRCKECLHVFSTAWYLNRVHKRYGLCRGSGSNGSNAPSLCPHCNKSYDDERRLRIHIKAFHSASSSRKEEENHQFILTRKLNTSSCSPSSFSSREEAQAPSLSSASDNKEPDKGGGGEEGMRSLGLNLFNEIIGSSKQLSSYRHQASNVTINRHGHFTSLQEVWGEKMKQLWPKE